MNVYPLRVAFDFQGSENVIYPVLLKNEHELVLVDCGYSGFMPLIEKAANTHGLSLKTSLA